MQKKENLLRRHQVFRNSLNVHPSPHQLLVTHFDGVIQPTGVSINSEWPVSCLRWHALFSKAIRANLGLTLLSITQRFLWFFEHSCLPASLHKATSLCPKSKAQARTTAGNYSNFFRRARLR